MGKYSKFAPRRHTNQDLSQNPKTKQTRLREHRLTGVEAAWRKIDTNARQKRFRLRQRLQSDKSLNPKELRTQLSTKYAEIEAERAHLKEVALQEFEALANELSSSDPLAQVMTENKMEIEVDEESEDSNHRDISGHENESSEVSLEHFDYDSNESDYSDMEFESSREDASETEDIDKEEAAKALKEIWSKRTKQISQRIERVERIGMDMLGQEEPDEESAGENEE